MDSFLFMLLKTLLCSQIKENIENTFGFQFFIVQNNTENTK